MSQKENTDIDQEESEQRRNHGCQTATDDQHKRSKEKRCEPRILCSGELFYHVGKPMTQKHRDLEIVVSVYLYSEEVTQRNNLRKKEGTEKGGRKNFKGCDKQWC